MAAEREKAKKHKTFNEIEKRKVRRHHFNFLPCVNRIPPLNRLPSFRSAIWANAVVPRVRKTSPT